MSDSDTCPDLTQAVPVCRECGVAPGADGNPFQCAQHPRATVARPGCTCTGLNATIHVDLCPVHSTLTEDQKTELHNKMTATAANPMYGYSLSEDLFVAPTPSAPERAADAARRHASDPEGPPTGKGRSSDARLDEQRAICTQVAIAYLNGWHLDEGDEDLWREDHAEVHDLLVCLFDAFNRGVAYAREQRSPEADKCDTCEVSLAPTEIDDSQIVRWNGMAFCGFLCAQKLGKERSSEAQEPWKADPDVRIGDEVELDNGPKLGGSDLWFVAAVRLCEDGHVQLWCAKTDTSTCGAPATSILRKTGRRWTTEERAKIVAWEKDTQDFLRDYAKERTEQQRAPEAKWTPPGMTEVRNFVGFLERIGDDEYTRGWNEALARVDEYAKKREGGTTSAKPGVMLNNETVPDCACGNGKLGTFHSCGLGGGLTQIEDTTAGQPSKASIKEVLDLASKDVVTWPDWKRSADVRSALPKDTTGVKGHPPIPSYTGMPYGERLLNWLGRKLFGD